MKVDKTLAASIALHVLVIGWGLVSFSSKAFVSMPEDSLPVDIISADQLAHVTKGVKTGQKDVKTPLAEKVAEPKPPVEDTVGKIDDKKPPVVTDTAPPPQPKPDEKAAAEAAKAAAVAKAQAEAKAAADAQAKADVKAKAAAETKIQAEALQQAKVEAEAKAQADAKAKAEAQAKAAAAAKAKAEAKAKSDADAKAKAETKAAEAKKSERTFEQLMKTALIDKRDPTRQSVSGDTLSSTSALGMAQGKAADNSATWGAMFKSQVERCWNKPIGGVEMLSFEAVFSINLKSDGTLAGAPQAHRDSKGSGQFFRPYLESGLRAIIACQPYNLPKAYFEEWKSFEPVFAERKSEPR